MNNFICGTCKIVGDNQEVEIKADAQYVHHYGRLTELKLDDTPLKLFEVKNCAELTKIDIKDAKHLIWFSLVDLFRFNPFIETDNPESIKPIRTIKTLELPPNIEKLYISEMELDEIYLPPSVKHAEINYKTQITNLDEFLKDPERTIQFNGR